METPSKLTPAPELPIHRHTNSSNSRPLKHVERIRKLVDILVSNHHFHLLIVEGPPGCGKSTAIDRPLIKLGLPFVSIGSVSTGRDFFERLSRCPDRIFVLDDTVGLMTTPQGISALKAVTWPSAGSDGRRIVSWGCANNPTLIRSFDFTGKIIVVCNRIGDSLDMQALKSRALHYKIPSDRATMFDTLRTAAESKADFSNTELARLALKFLIDEFEPWSDRHLNLRSLRHVYELAIQDPDEWRELAQDVLPKGCSDPLEFVEQLAETDLTVGEQEREFARITGKKRRTFYNYRKKAGLKDL